jgi:Uncharacterized conserved protein (DUF2190)
VSSNNLATPYYEPGSRITGRAFGAAVIGKRFVALAAKKDPGSRELDPAATGGNIRIKPAVANDARLLGVAETDAADGKVTTVFTDGFAVPVTAGGVINYGDLVTSDATGKAVVVGAGARLDARGISMSDAALDQDAIILLRL